MVARVSLACDGTIPGGGYECRQATPSVPSTTGAGTREVAHRLHRWRVAVDPTGRIFDLCPGCADRYEHLTRQGLRLLPPGRATAAAVEAAR